MKNSLLDRVNVQIPAGDVGVLTEIDPIIGVDCVQPQDQLEEIAGAVIGGEVELGL